MTRGTAQRRRNLLAWYDRERRALPWRCTRDPYAIWISEAMLQQTRVETVIPYYERFLERLPDVESLATADADEVLGLWAGLGYYSRARNLQTAARQVLEEFGGRIPDDVESLQRLRGVGRYTAGAIASIAFDRPAPVLDGNVTRVLTRWLEIREDPTSPAVARRLWEEAAALADGPRPGDLNQALMELGARVCTPRSPACEACPVARGCRARAAGDPEALPVRRRPARRKRVRSVATLLCREGRVLAVRRPPTGLFGGLWELPSGEIARGEAPDAASRRTVLGGVGLSVGRLESIGPVDHELTHRRLRQFVFRTRPAPGRVQRDGYDAHRWVRQGALQRLPLSSAARRVIEHALAAEGPEAPSRG